MNARKMRNRQIYYATHQTASAQLSSELSNDLKKKYGKRSIRVLEGDTVKVIRGEFSGVDGKVTKVSLIKNGINIEGVKKDRVKGDKFDVYIHTTNIVITGINTDDKWRMNRLEGKKPRSVRIKPKTDKIEKKNDNDENKTKKDTTKKQKVNKTKTEKEVN
jgi:large subunit ribosomal protein L24|tara:strand:+ start:1319 stop:1801 length:483 start_codon:yes stop_codon:yes gene_type:complete